METRRSPNPEKEGYWFSRTNRFQFAFDGEHWSLVVHFTPGGEHREEAFFDGRSVFYSNYQTGESMTPQQRQMDSNGVAIAFVRDSFLPEEASVDFRFLWLAFGSGPFFASATNHNLLAPWAVMNSGFGRSFAFDADLLSSTSGLPSRVDFSFSADLWERLVKNGQVMQSEISNIRTEYRYTNGWRGGRYDVIRSTNLNGTLLPLEGVMRRFGLVPVDGHSQGVGRFSYRHVLIEEYLLLCTEVSLTTEAIRPIATASPRLASSIVDYRHASPKEPDLYIRWTNSPAEWPARDDPRVVVELAKSRDRLAAARNASRMRWIRPLGAVVILGLILMPVAFVLRRALQGSNEREPT